MISTCRLPKFPSLVIVYLLILSFTLLINKNNNTYLSAPASQSSSLWQQVFVLLSVQVLLSYLMIYLRLQVASLETRTKTVIDAHTCICKFQSAFVADEYELRSVITLHEHYDCTLYMHCM